MLQTTISWEGLKLDAAKQRNIWLDNLRGFAIFFTCFAHFISLNRTDFNWILNVSIYVFHMPLFAFVSGASELQSHKSQAKKSLICLSQYCMAQLACALLWSNQISIKSILLYPAGINWFFLSLLFWRISMYFIHALTVKQLKMVFTLSLFVCLMYGFVNFDWGILSLGRTLYLYPYFLLGFMVSKKEKALVPPKPTSGSKRHLIFFLAAIIAIEILIIQFIPQINRSWTFGSYSYQQMDYNIFIRSINILFALVWIAFLYFTLHNSSVPLFAWFGQNTLSIYFGHGLFYMQMIYTQFSLSELLPNGTITIVILVLSLFVCALFSLPAIVKIIKFYLNLPIITYDKLRIHAKKQ